MKKILPIILAVSLFTATTVFGAATIDLSGMTVDELLELRQQIDDEIMAQNGASSSSSIISGGDYLVGRDIKAGSYIILNTSDTWMEAFVYETKDAYESGDSPTSDAYCDSGDPITLNLQDDMFVVLLNGPGIISEASFNWAP